MVVDDLTLNNFWGLVEWYFSLPHLSSVLFSILGVLALFVGLIQLIRRV